MTVKEFWESARDLGIHCDTKEKANKLLKKFHELGKKWNSGMSYLEDSNYYIYFQERTVFLNNGLLSSLSNAKRQNIEIIEFDDLDDFKEKENHEKDVFDYMNKSFDSCKLDIKILKTGTFKLENLGGTMFGLESVTKDMLIVDKEKKDVFDYGFNHLITLPKEKFNVNSTTQFLGQMFFPIPKSPKDMLIVNKEKKYVLLKLDGEEYRVDCHKEDKFDWQIGFGLALSQCNGKCSKWENMREFYRNKNRKLNYKEYAKWCIIEYFENDMIEINNLKKKIKEINEYGKVDL